MARDGSREKYPRRWLWLEHAYLNDVDLHQLIEQSLDGDKGVVTALFKEQFVTLMGRQVTVPRVHVARTPLNSQLVRNVFHRQRVVDASAARMQLQCPLHASVKPTALSGVREPTEPAPPTPHAHTHLRIC